MLIGDEKTTDWPAVHSLNVAAFPTAAEADLVDVLRLQAKPFISLVADEAEAIVGHILFTPVSLAGHPNLNLMGSNEKGLVRLWSKPVSKDVRSCRWVGSSC